jgi:DNA-directed RNA polymerase I subunit RPA49
MFAKTHDRILCTARCQDKVLCFLFVLCLIIDDFTVDIGLLAHDLQLGPKKYALCECPLICRAQELFKTVGCKIIPLSDADIAQKGITKSEAKTLKLAKLKCPPEFPRMRRRGQARRRG